MKFFSWERSCSQSCFFEVNEVHLWCASLQCTDSQLHAFQALISPVEQASAKMFVKEADQRKYSASRAIMRDILSRYLRVMPRDIEFIFNDHGKPFVKNNPLQFNVSNSGDYFLMGLTRDALIGVDIERVREHQDYLALAKRFFTQAEFVAIQSAGDPVAAFYRCWTRKEAFVKAMGLGLTFGLANFEVAVVEMPFEKSALVSVCGDEPPIKKWLLQSVVLEGVSSDYFAAVAVSGE